MSLIAHYPLNGDTLDYSKNGYDGVNSGATINASGKIGKCYSFTQTGADGVNIPNTNFAFLKDNYSMSIWINPAGSHYHYNGTFISSGNWNSNPWAFGISQDNSQIDVLGNGFNKYVNCPVPLNVWTHIACVVQNNISKLYKNGSYVGQLAVVGALASDATNTFIARETYAGGYFSFNGKLNDLRVYDHALSDKEIKELSKAKVLHYKFDDFQEPTVNLYRRNNLLAGGTPPHDIAYFTGTTYVSGVLDVFGRNDAVRVTGGSSATIRYGSSTGANLEITTGKTYTFSIYAKLCYGWTPPTVFNIDIGDSGTSNFIGGLTYDWKRFSMIVTPSVSANYGFADIAISAGGVIELCFPQIEEKGHITEFTTSSRDGVVKDCSGYRHDTILALASTPQWTTDSKIGNGAYYFSGISDYIQLGDIGSFSDFTNCTISFWRKNDTIITNWLPFIGHTTSLYLMATSAGTGAFYHAGAGTPKIYKDGVYTAGATPFTDQNWHHYVMTNVNLSTWTAMKLSGYGGVWNSEGYFDDLRIYNTELSDSDIKDLYQTRASIDDKGTLHTDLLISNGIGGVSENKVFYNNWEEGDYSSTNKSFAGDLPSHSTTIVRCNDFSINVLPLFNPKNILDRILEYKVTSTHFVNYAHPTSYYYFTFDNTKTYRYTQWIYRHAEPSSSYASRCYLGIEGNTVCNVNTTTLNSNPYFTSMVMNDAQYADKWVLQEFYIYPNGSVGNPAGGRINYVDGTSIAHGTSYNWASSAASHIRQFEMYEYGTIAAGTYVLHYRPRLDVVDGTEPSIESLLSCGEHMPLVTDMYKSNHIYDSGISGFRDTSEVGITKGLVAYYPLNGDAKDYSGNKNHAVVTGATVANGINSSCYDLDGVDDYIYIPSNTLLNSITSITFTAWMRLDDAGNWMIFYKGNCYAYGDNNTGAWVIYDTLGARQQISIGTIAVGVWTSVAVTYNRASGIMQAYKDGILVSSLGSVTWGNQATNINVGCYSSATSYSLHGLVQDIRIYDRALTPEEIAIQYDITKPNFTAMKMTQNSMYIKQIKEI